MTREEEIAQIVRAQCAVGKAVIGLLKKFPSQSGTVAVELLACAMVTIVPSAPVDQARSEAIKIVEQAIAKLKLARAEPMGGVQ